MYHLAFATLQRDMLTVQREAQRDALASQVPSFVDGLLCSSATHAPHERAQLCHHREKLGFVQECALVDTEFLAKLEAGQRKTHKSQHDCDINYYVVAYRLHSSCVWVSGGLNLMMQGTGNVFSTGSTSPRTSNGRCCFCFPTGIARRRNTKNDSRESRSIHWLFGRDAARVRMR